MGLVDLTYATPCQPSSSDGSFQRTHGLLCRWQRQLELFLYDFCRITAPALVEECHWSCPEAAELSRLSEKLTEYFCFHRKEMFHDCGISDLEREIFCSDLHLIRRIRHCAVHRVNVNWVTLGAYAKSMLNVLAILHRLGGAEFERSDGEKVCFMPSILESSVKFVNIVLPKLECFIQTLWVVQSCDMRPEGTAQSCFQRQEDDRSELYMLLLEGKAVNIQRMLQSQNIAMERKLNNITRMVEDYETSLVQKAARRIRANQQIEEAQRRKAERIQRSQNARVKTEQSRGQEGQNSQQRNERDRDGQNEPMQHSQPRNDKNDQGKSAKSSQPEEDKAPRKENECMRHNQETSEVEQNRNEHRQRIQHQKIEAKKENRGSSQKNQDKVDESKNMSGTAKAKEGRHQKANICNAANTKTMRQDVKDMNTHNTSNSSQSKKASNTANTKQTRLQSKKKSPHDTEGQNTNDPK